MSLTSNSHNGQMHEEQAAIALAMSVAANNPSMLKTLPFAKLLGVEAVVKIFAGFSKLSDELKDEIKQKEKLAVEEKALVKYAQMSAAQPADAQAAQMQREREAAQDRFTSSVYNNVFDYDQKRLFDSIKDTDKVGVVKCDQHGKIMHGADGKPIIEHVDGKKIKRVIASVAATAKPEALTLQQKEDENVSHTGKKKLETTDDIKKKVDSQTADLTKLQEAKAAVAPTEAQRQEEIKKAEEVKKKAEETKKQIDEAAKNGASVMQMEKGAEKQMKEAAKPVADVKAGSFQVTPASEMQAAAEQNASAASGFGVAAPAEAPVKLTYREATDAEKGFNAVPSGFGNGASTANIAR